MTINITVSPTITINQKADKIIDSPIMCNCDGVRDISFSDLHEIGIDTAALLSVVEQLGIEQQRAIYNILHAKFSNIQSDT